MKKSLRPQPNEPLHIWVERLACNLDLTEKQKEAMHEVARWSYIRGVNNGIEEQNKYIKK